MRSVSRTVSTSNDPQVSEATEPPHWGLRCTVQVLQAAFGHVHLALLTDDGHVLTCSVGDDGFASALPSTRHAGGQPPLNAHGELGRAGDALMPAAVRLGDVHGAVDVAAGFCFTLALDAAGLLWSW
jgi:alpha-tubulin suppressor-like RCC1 family protein